MKKISFMVALLATVLTNFGFAQNGQTQSLLTSYYDIKNALINADASLAASKAAEFSKVLGSMDMKSLPEADLTTFMGLQNKLASDAKDISVSKDIAYQRAHFADFSINLFKEEMK